MEGCFSERAVVIKLGGSVLTDEESYRQAARFLLRRLQNSPKGRFVVVVSARKGLTDHLERVAREITGYPNRRTLDLLWSTGEMQSVALLTLHLEELGVAVVGLNVHETGLRLNGADPPDASVELLAGELTRAFYDHSVVVVPGFFGTLTSETLVSLGRGGSDLSAVLLADDLQAERCELIKDVPGYFTEDPRVNARATYLPWISYETAVQMAESGCELVQRIALEAARERNLQLLVRSLDNRRPGTVVSTQMTEPRACVTES